jgi:hypothetical protein
MDNQIFTRLRAEWDTELRLDEAPPTDLYESMMNHAGTIIEQRDGDPKYGIFAVAHCEDGCDVDGPPYEAFVHISHKLPNTSDATLRVLWNLFAPRHQMDIRAAELARIMTAIVMGAFDLSRTHMPARQIKMYLGNAIDREFATIAAAFLETNDASISFAVHRSWLHIQPT